MKRDRRSKFGSTLLLLFGVAFGASILWSLWFETLQPLLQQDDQRGLMLHALGVPLIFGGTALFVYGGWVFISDTYGAFADQGFARDAQTIQKTGPGLDLLPVRWRNLMHLLRAWRPGLLRMGLGFALLALGGYLINL